jgi:putative membrane protein insertion efficiency factor
MGHRDTPARFGGHSGFFGARPRIVEADSARAREHAVNLPRAQEDAAPRSTSAAAWTLLLLVRVYISFLSPFFGGACRFHPSCSNYALEAIQRHGAWRGLGLAVWRLLRCNPFNKPGFDSVPDETRSGPVSLRSAGDSQ